MFFSFRNLYFNLFARGFGDRLIGIKGPSTMEKEPSYSLADIIWDSDSVGVCRVYNRIVSSRNSLASTFACSLQPSRILPMASFELTIQGTLTTF